MRAALGLSRVPSPPPPPCPAPRAGAQAVAQGCFEDLLKIICKEPKTEKYRAGL